MKEKISGTKSTIILTKRHESLAVITTLKFTQVNVAILPVLNSDISFNQLQMKHSVTNHCN